MRERGREKRESEGKGEYRENGERGGGKRERGERRKRREKGERVR